MKNMKIIRSVYRLRKIIERKSIIITALLILTGSIAGLIASPSFLIIENGDVFKNRKRPPVEFEHRKHEKAGLKCEACHHGNRTDIKSLSGTSEKKGTGRIRCAACHGGSGTKLMRSYHKMCTDCHIKMKKGPIFCGSCHRKQK